MTTVTDKIVNALTKGRTLTTKQLASMGASNPHASMWYVRTRGYNVISESVKTRTGVQTKYRLAV